MKKKHLLILTGLFGVIALFLLFSRPTITGGAVGGFWGPTYCWSGEDCSDLEVCCYVNGRATCTGSCDEGRILESNWFDDEQAPSSVSKEQNLTTVAYSERELEVDEGSRNFEVDVVE